MKEYFIDNLFVAKVSCIAVAAVCIVFPIIMQIVHYLKVNI